MPYNVRSTTKRYVVIITRLILLGVIIFFVIRQIAHHWQEIKQYDWQTNWNYLILSVIFSIGTFFAFSSIWQKIMVGFGHRLSLTGAFRIFYLSNLGRYIPGKIWQLFGILYLTKQAGIPPERAGASFILVQLFAVPASFLIFVLTVLIEPRVLVDQVAVLGNKSAVIIAAAMVAVSLVIILWPQKVLAIGNAILRRLKRPQATLMLDKKVALGIFVGYCLAWTLYGVAFWLFVRAVTGYTGISLMAAVGVFNAAYQIGYLALFAPGGFGPRELVMGFMLMPFVGPIAPAVAILARVWLIIAESIAAIIALGLRK
ncbi:MAG: YbhN family protein [Candidatus Zixiibacteriota bacterium]